LRGAGEGDVQRAPAGRGLVGDRVGLDHDHAVELQALRVQTLEHPQSPGVVDQERREELGRRTHVGSGGDDRDRALD
jgi:hypothetical protein